MPAVVYIETHGGTGIGGSDDHAGVDIGRTFTEVPAASTPEEFLRRPARRRGRGRRRAGQRRQVGARGDGAGDPRPRPRRTGPAGEGAPDPAAVLKMAQRVIGEGAAREGKVAADIGPDDARALLEAWLRLDRPRAARPRADRLPAVRRLLPRRPLPPRPPHPRAAPARGGRRRRRGGRRGRRSPAPSAASSRRCVPAVPYAPSTAFLGAEKAKLAARAGERPRVALIADGIGSMHGVTHTIEQIRERGVPGFEVEVVGTDPGVDRRLPAAAELEVPFYEGMTPRRARPARPGRDPRRGPLRPRPRHRARPGRHRRDAAQPDHRDAAARQLPHRAGRLRRPAQRRRRPRGDGAGGARRLLRRPLAGPLAEPRGRPLAARARRRPGPDRPLGARRRRLPLRPGQGRPRRLSRASSRSSTPAG